MERAVTREKQPNERRKLTDEQVREIQIRHDKDGEDLTLANLARIYKCSTYIIFRAVHGHYDNTQ